MPASPCYLIKNVLEFQDIDKVNTVPRLTRGIYVLYQQREGGHMDVVYVGMARGEKSGVRSRLIKHRTHKATLWSHFSVFAVWDNITESQVEELEGLFRHIYRHDEKANALNVQGAFKPLRQITRKTVEDWV